MSTFFPTSAVAPFSPATCDMHRSTGAGVTRSPLIRRKFGYVLHLLVWLILIRYPKPCPFPQEHMLFFIPSVEERLSRKNFPTKKRIKKEQRLSIDISDDGDHGASQRRERQPQSSWYLPQPTLRCACSFFSAFWMSSSKWAMANAMPRPSGLGLGFRSGFFAHCLPSSDSPSKRSCCMAIDLPSMILGRMILWSLEALAQTGFFAWYTNDWFMPDRFHTGSYRFGARFVFFSSLSQLANSVWQFVETDFLKLLMDSFVCRLTTLQFWKYRVSPQSYDKSAKTAFDSAQVSNPRCPHLSRNCTSRCSEPESLGANHWWVGRSGTGGRVIQTGRMCQQPHVQLLYSEMMFVSDEAMQ